MFIEFHLIQNFAPSCLNRDDTNSPKDCVFGGVRRARISSQCLKRAMRTDFQERGLPKENVGVRTKRLHTMLCDRLTGDGKDAEAAASVVSLLINQLGLNFKDKDEVKRTQYVLFLGSDEVDEIVRLALTQWDVLVKESEKKSPGGKGLDKDLSTAINKLLEGDKAADLALFGRMLADIPQKNVDAACQVAHAISTHRVDMEMDFFTAVDDLKRDDTSGADMMGTVEFNSACFYRYAVIQWEKLVENLGGNVDLARATVKAFANAAIAAIPTGKQNTFAAHNPPSLVFAVVRETGCPWSLANAFEAAARANGKGLVAASIEKMDIYRGQLCAMYGNDTTMAAHVALDSGAALKNLGDSAQGVEALVEAVLAALPGAVS